MASVLRRWGVTCGLCSVFGLEPATSVFAQTSSPDSISGTYYLAASVNGRDQQLIVRVDRVAGGFCVSVDELRELGVRTERLVTSNRNCVALDAIPDLTYHYDAQAQRIDFKLPDSQLQPEQLGYRAPPPSPTSGTGLLLNYAVNAQGTRISYVQRNDAQRLLAPAQGEGSYGSSPPLSESEATAAYNALNRTLAVGTELRLFSPIGDFVNSGYTTVEGGQSRYLRQDTYWNYASTTSLITYTAGDQVSSSLPWSRSIRLGGFGIAYNFTVRPDLVTFPVPALGGSAVVPTTVDLYINGLRQFSGLANGGPFLIDTPPSLTGAGHATLVYRDALGREVNVNQALYVDPRLLSQGLSEWSFEMGYPRMDYGSRSFDYISKPAANGTWRYGVDNAFTAEAHMEMMSGLHNIGAGGPCCAGALRRAQRFVHGASRRQFWRAGKLWLSIHLAHRQLRPARHADLWRLP
ncbi:FimD/PapC N-terminal domain-containing protein [Dyella terrae]|uniref:FimD/PapC N-terminal domain-containing protein n=1 Tax=Dyella terrae TaxID=522259 RepID=UPI001EFDF43A|nr:FimD/PapC N-terminal domain-containing protein [Dyella terrae]